MIGDTDKQTQFNKSVYSPLKRTRSFVTVLRSHLANFSPARFLMT